MEEIESISVQKTRGLIYQPCTSVSGLQYFLKGSCFYIYEDLIVFLYATECSRVRACQFRMCGIYEWTMRTAVAQHTCVINTNFLVRVWVGLVYKKNRTCLTHVLINETLDPCQIL